MSKPKNNPILYEHKGIAVKKINSFRIDLNEMEMRRLIDARESTGWKLSAPQILAIQGRPCQSCGHENTCIPIAKGILSVNKQASGPRGLQPENNG